MLELLLVLGARARSSVSLVDTKKTKIRNTKNISTSTGLRQPRTQHAWLGPRAFWVPGVWLSLAGVGGRRLASISISIVLVLVLVLIHVAVLFQAQKQQTSTN